MVSIKDRKILRQMFSHYDYVMTTAQLSKEKLYYRDIQRMLGAGLIEKVKRGYYHWTMGSGKCYSNLNHTSAAHTTPPVTGVLPLCTRLRRVRRNNPPWRSL